VYNVPYNNKIVYTLAVDGRIVTFSATTTKPRGAPPLSMFAVKMRDVTHQQPVCQSPLLVPCSGSSLCASAVVATAFRLSSGFRL